MRAPEFAQPADRLGASALGPVRKPVASRRSDGRQALQRSTAPPRSERDPYSQSAGTGLGVGVRASACEPESGASAVNPLYVKEQCLGTQALLCVTALAPGHVRRLGTHEVREPWTSLPCGRVGLLVSRGRGVAHRVKHSTLVPRLFSWLGAIPLVAGWAWPRPGLPEHPLACLPLLASAQTRPPPSPPCLAPVRSQETQPSMGQPSPSLLPLTDP